MAHGVFVDVAKSSNVSWKGSKLLVKIGQFLAKKNFAMKRESICLHHAYTPTNAGLQLILKYCYF